ncbi:hypothetical protein [Variovorax sp. HW608]|uniref:hypothetical protein n=1 Tax=Variovorax sp. HW608 TaxID=1034889 RepID=UPI000B5AD1E9|nr:hypothetical protein [Variovorax sp. HW608]
MQTKAAFGRLFVWCAQHGADFWVKVPGQADHSKDEAQLREVAEHHGEEAWGVNRESRNKKRICGGTERSQQANHCEAHGLWEGAGLQ